MTDIEEIITHPISWLVGLVASILAVNPTVVLGFVEATYLNLGSLFSFVSLAGLTLPRYWPPSNSAEWLILAIGAAFAAKIGHKIWETYDREI
ncbi:hypothetical protein [Halorhabdus sp. CUG00001]|uniref:hypothetical protein n=1 Tax=Halorhabdus sp. CUG00001 TaxID=2600297 RepID=UPI00131B0CE4|nr:hypothetical protein [Halorhabdus sp. CUG00001]